MKQFIAFIILCFLSASAWAGDYRITLEEAETAITQALIEKGIGDDIAAHAVGRTGSDLLHYNEPVTMDVQDVTVDEQQQRFRATLFFATEAQLNKPSRSLGTLELSGRYDEIFSIPVVQSRIGSGDIIKQEDITWQKLPGNRLRHDTIRDAQKLIGSTPVRGLSPMRPVRETEVKTPPLVLRQSLVQMQYQTRNLSIQALGTAMQDGAMGEKIKVRNDDSGTLVDAVVVDKGKVRILSAGMR